MYLAGIFMMTLGIALSCKAGLGTTPISSVPYVLSMCTDYTLGELTVVMNMLFIVAQPVLLRAFHWKKIMGQAATIMLFGPAIDFFMYLLDWLQPDSYFEMWGVCILSAYILAFGVFLCIKADIFTAAGEGLVLAMESVTKINFPFLKNCFDITLATISIAISYYVFGEIHGIGAGTVASAVLVGRFIRVDEKYFHFFY